jgi:hypothetical protein
MYGAWYSPFQERDEPADRQRHHRARSGETESARWLGEKASREPDQNRGTLCFFWNSQLLRRMNGNARKKCFFGEFSG